MSISRAQQQAIEMRGSNAKSVAAKRSDGPTSYVLEGSIAVTGAAVQWLRDQLGLIRTAAEVEELARSVEDNGGVYLVPAFSGLFAPYWRDDARGAIVGLTAYAAATASELPYGRKRALELATTLALDPEMLLLDEPTAGMGHEDIDRISSLIKAVAVNRTVLMVEHNLSVVATLSDRITVLTRGRILAEGDYEAVSANPEVREAYMGVGHG